MNNPHAHVRILPGNCGLSQLTPSLGTGDKKTAYCQFDGNPPAIPNTRDAGTITLNRQDDLADVGSVHAGMRRRRLTEGERGIDDDLHALLGVRTRRRLTWR